MKNKDAIAILQKLDPEAELVIQTKNSLEMGNSEVLVRRISTFKGVKAEREFKDAFDYENYTSLVIERDNNNDNSDYNFITFS